MYRAAPNSELDLQCFQVLLKASLNNQICQETIRRFYEYGYFNEDEQIEELIDRSQPQEQIDRKQQIEQMPAQVDRIRQEIEELCAQFSNLEQVLDQKIEDVKQSFENQFSQLNVSQNVSRLAQSVESLKSRIGEVETSLKNRIETLENLQPETDSAINAFVDHTEEMINRIEQQIQDTNQSVEERLGNLGNAFDKIKSVLENRSN